MNESNSKDVYELKFEVSEDVLAALNKLDEVNPYLRLYAAIGSSNDLDDQRLCREGYIDLLDAALSGKRVVNPKTDRERLEEIHDKYVSYIHEDLPAPIAISDLKTLLRIAGKSVGIDVAADE
jgi:hypothetical protein